MKILRLLWLSGIVLAFSSITPCLSSPSDIPETLTILAIRVEFQPDDQATTTGDGTFDLTTGSDPFQIDPPPHNRRYFQDHLLFANRYYHRLSRGALTVSGRVYPLAQNEAYRLDNTMSSYNPNTTSEEINQGLARLFRDAVIKADEDPAVHFGDYNSYIVFHAGVGRDINLGLDETPQDIPSLFITQKFLREHLGIEGIPVDGGATLVTSGIILPETESQAGLQLGLNGMLVSNIGSQLGWLDLFNPEDGRSGVGRFGLMDAGLFNGDGLLPALPTAWTRVDGGWETPVTITQAQGDEFTVYHTLSARGPRVYRLPVNEREYFLLENRYAGRMSLDSLQFVLSQDRDQLASMREVLATFFPGESVFSDSTGVLIDVANPDIGLPGGGVLVWHIDETVIEHRRADNRINVDPEHRGVDLEEADGSQDIGFEFDLVSGGAGSEIGTALDPWYEGNTAPLFSADPKNEFSLRSTPNSRSYSNRANSHLRIYNFSGRDSVMTFMVDLNFFQPNYPRRFDTGNYGKASALKIADLNNDGRDELVVATDQNKVLVMDQTGRSPWDGDTLQVITLEDNMTLLPPPAVFQLADGQQAIVLLTREGRASGFRFNSTTQKIDTLFGIQSSDSITTFPIVENTLDDERPLIYWGCADGKVYRLTLDNPPGELSIFADISEAIQQLHFSDVDQAIIISRSGKVYQNETSLAELPVRTAQPVGPDAVTVSRDGLLFQLRELQFDHAENGIHRFDSPVITFQYYDDLSGQHQQRFAVAGKNQLYFFNYNLTLSGNFPVKLYNPDRSSDLFLTPLAGNFPGENGEDLPGLVVSDPAGMITGFDLKGRLLPDFPLAVGDSLRASPALLDIDGDEDLELACVTVTGIVYVWDFPSGIGIDRNWSQLYGTAQNQNRDLVQGEVIVTRPERLLPAETAYNWPNPNIDNYTFIRYRLNAPAEVLIKIYDLAGDLVEELTGTGDTLTDNEVRWDLTGVQSGVYLGRIEARGSSKTEVQLIKIAVVK